MGSEAQSANMHKFPHILHMRGEMHPGSTFPMIRNLERVSTMSHNICSNELRARVNRDGVVHVVAGKLKATIVKGAITHMLLDGDLLKSQYLLQ